jgi:hypothetical protein
MRTDLPNWNLVASLSVNAVHISDDAFDLTAAVL